MGQRDDRARMLARHERRLHEIQAASVRPGRSGTAREAPSAGSGHGEVRLPCGVQPAAPNISEEGAARLAFRDGEQPGVLEIISVDAEGKCVVHRVAGLALINLAFKAVDQIRRGAK